MLSINNLIKIYPGPVPALQGVSLEIPLGMFGLLGPNGSGKTTLMRILAGLLEPTAGSVALGGVDVTGRPELVWPRLGNLPQDFGFYPHLTGRAMLRHILELKGVEAPRGLSRLTDELLERVNLTAAAGRKTKTYSGGMRQRLGIAQAIAGDPDLIIVDEPTAGLDPEERLRLYALLSELAEGRTVLLSTHIVEDVATLCPRLAVIRAGRVLANTTPAEARETLAGHMYAGTVTPMELQRIAPVATVTKRHFMEGRTAVRAHAPGSALHELLEPVPPTLEDAYLLLMRQDDPRPVEQTKGTWTAA